MTKPKTPQPPSVGAPLERGVRPHARLRWDSSGCIDEVQQDGDKVRVIRGLGYVRPDSIACELTDTGNGFIAYFPGNGSCDMAHCISLDYAQARELVLALTPHAKRLGFAAKRPRR